MITADEINNFGVKLFEVKSIDEKDVIFFNDDIETLKEFCKHHEINSAFYTHLSSREKFESIYPIIRGRGKRVEEFLKFTLIESNKELHYLRQFSDEYTYLSEFRETVDAFSQLGKSLDKTVGEFKVYVPFNGKFFTCIPIEAEWLKYRELFEKYSNKF